MQGYALHIAYNYIITCRSEQIEIEKKKKKKEKEEEERRSKEKTNANCQWTFNDTYAPMLPIFLYKCDPFNNNNDNNKKKRRNKTHFLIQQIAIKIERETI